MNTTTDKATHHTYVRDWDSDSCSGGPAVIVVELDPHHPDIYQDAFTRVLAAGAKHYRRDDGTAFEDGEAFEDATWNTLHLLADVSMHLSEAEAVYANLADADGPIWSGHTDEDGLWCLWSGKRVTHQDPQDRCPEGHTATRIDGPARPPALIDIDRVVELLIGQGIACHTVGINAGRRVLVTFDGDLPVVRLAERPGEPGWAMVVDRPDDTEVTLWASDHDTTNVIAAAVMAEQHRAMVRYAAERRER